jgi:hypothetical protein
MKKHLTLFALCASFAATGHAQQILTDGQSGLLVGFDFSNLTYPSGSGGTFNAGLYSDIGTGDDSAPGTYVSRGTLYMNGTNGSDAWNRYTSGSGANTAGVDLSSNNSITSSLSFRGGVAGKSFSGYNSSLGEIGGEALASSPKSLQIRTNNTASLNNIVFVINSTDFNLNEITFGAKFSATGPTGSINWKFSTTTDFTSATDLGTYTITDTDTKFTVPLSSVNAADNITAGYYSAIFSSSSNTAQFQLDNVQFTGVSVAAIPEPSSFAALAGLLGLGFAASRRRRA